MIAPEIKAQVTHVMKHMKTFGDDLRELGVDLADVNPRLLLRNARAQDARVVCYFVLIDGGDGAETWARRRNYKAVRRWRARRRRYPPQVINHDGWAARMRCLLCFSRYSPAQRVRAHVRVPELRLVKGLGQRGPVHGYFLHHAPTGNTVP